MKLDIIGADLPEFLEELHRYQGNLLLVGHPELQGVTHFPNVNDVVANAYSQLTHGHKAVQDIALFEKFGWASPGDLSKALAFMRAHFPGVEARALAHDHFAAQGFSSLGHWMQEKLGVNGVFSWEGEQSEQLCGGTLRALSPLPDPAVLHPLLVRALPDSVALVMHGDTFTVLHPSLNSPQTFPELTTARNRALELACEAVSA